MNSKCGVQRKKNYESNESCIQNVGSKAREGAEAMSLAFVLLDFQHAGVRRRA